MEIANEESIYQANTISTKQGEGPVQKKKKKNVQKPCTCTCGKGLLCTCVQLFLEILTVSVMIHYKCGESIFITCRKCATTE